MNKKLLEQLDETVLRVENGESLKSVLMDLGVSKQGLKKIYKACEVLNGNRN